jgi:hypothetical protein
MSLSQNYPNGYESVLYPRSSNFQENILPKIHDSGMGGNSSAYNSNQVGGGKRYKRMRKSVRKMRRSYRGRRYRRRGTMKRR